MRRALGRLLGVVLTLVLVSLFAVAALSELPLALGARRARLPLYFNPKPANVHDLAEHAIARITAGEPAEMARAEHELARLGGAALPHILPKLSELPSTTRRRVALALAPVARRMQLEEHRQLDDPERALAFWEAFWQDHEFDFRPQVRKRLVARVAEHASRHARDEIIRLDTYALPELIVALGRIRSDADIARARRLTLLLGHVTEHGPVVDRQASVADARSVARFWRRYLVEEGSDFMTLDGPTRLVALFAQTAYGRWLGRLFGLVSVGQERQPALGLPLEAALSSLARYLTALTLSVALAVGIAGAELRARFGLARAARFAALVLLSAPAVLVVSSLDRPTSPLARSLLATFVPAVLAAFAISRVELASADARAADGASFRVVFAGVLRATPSAAPWLFTSLFALELVLDLEGAARAVLDGLRRADIRAGMVVALASTLIAAGLATLADATARPTFLPGRKPALVDVGTPVRRPWLLAGLATCGVLAGFALLGPHGEARIPGWPEVARGARALLGYGMVALAVAGAGGIALGALAAGGSSRTLDALLVRASELCSALPAALWAAAITQALGAGFWAALALGVLRSVDVAWVLRSELRSAGGGEDEPSPTDGRHQRRRLPYATFFRQRVRPALFPALTVLALTPAWWVALATFGALLELPAVPGGGGWEALLGKAAGLPSITAFALLAALVIVLHGLFTASPRRVGAFRASSIPPPPPRARVELPPS